MSFDPYAFTGRDVGKVGIDCHVNIHVVGPIFRSVSSVDGITAVDGFHVVADVEDRAIVNGEVECSEDVSEEEVGAESAAGFQLSACTVNERCRKRVLIGS